MSLVIECDSCNSLYRLELALVKGRGSCILPSSPSRSSSSCSPGSRDSSPSHLQARRRSRLSSPPCNRCSGGDGKRAIRKNQVHQTKKAAPDEPAPPSSAHDLLYFLRTSLGLQSDLDIFKLVLYNSHHEIRSARHLAPVGQGFEGFF